MEATGFTHANFGDSKLSKSKELSTSMSIKPSERDAYETKLHALGGE